MTGGTISTGSSTGYAVYAREKSRVNIGGGNVTGGTAVMVYDSANVTVTGGTLEGKKAAIGKGSSATPVISVTGGKFSSDVKEFVPRATPLIRTAKATSSLWWTRRRLWPRLMA